MGHSGFLPARFFSRKALSSSSSSFFSFFGACSVVSAVAHALDEELTAHLEGLGLAAFALTAHIVCCLKIGGEGLGMYRLFVVRES